MRWATSYPGIRSTNQPWAMNQRSLRRSFSGSSWESPPTSMIKRLEKQTKSGMNGPMGTCLRNFTPSRFALTWCHSSHSPTVGSDRMRFAYRRSTCGSGFDILSSYQMRTPTRTTLLVSPSPLVASLLTASPTRGEAFRFFSSLPSWERWAERSEGQRGGGRTERFAAHRWHAVTVRACRRS